MRDLRGARTEDIIHAGPRRTLGLAEVSLTFDRVNGDDGQRDLAVARRLFRSGESEYLVNRTRVRLRDLQAALRRVSIDGGRYVVVNQGMADGLLTATPMERRAVLEQAAGLHGYRTQRDEAKSKLASTGQNMQTIEVVLAELEPRLRVLRRQAKAVQERDEAIRVLRGRLKAWYGRLWWEAGAKRRLLVQACEEIRAEREAVELELRRLEAQADTDRAAERDWRAQHDVVVAAVHATQREHDAARFRLSELEAQIGAIGERLDEFAARVERVRQARVEGISHLDAAERKRADLVHQRDGLNGEASTFRDSLEFSLSYLARLERAFRERALALEQAERGATHAEEQIRRVRGEVEDSRSRLEHLERRRREAEAEMTESARPLAELRADRERFAADEARAADALAIQEAILRSARGRVERIERLSRRLTARRQDLSRRRQIVERSLAALAAATADNPVRDLLVPPGWETAVSAAIGIWNGRHVPPVSAVDTAEYLKWRRTLDAPPGQASWADEVLDVGDGPGARALRGTLFVGSASDAETLWRRILPLPAHTVGSPPIQVVARDGTVWSARGREHHGGQEPGARFLEHRREMIDIDSSLQLTGTRIHLSAEALREARNWVANHEVEAGGARTAMQAAVNARGEADEAIDRIERRLRRAREELDRSSAAASSLSTALRAAEQRQEALAASLAREREIVQAAASERDAGAEAVRQARTDAETTREQLDQTRRRQQIVAAEVSAQEGLSAALRRDVERLHGELTADAAEEERLTRERELRGEEASILRGRLEDIGAVLAEQVRHRERHAAERPAEVGEDRGVARARERLSGAVARHERLLAQIALTDEEITRLRAEIEREMGVDPVNLPAAVEEAPAEDEIRRLRNRATQYPDADLSVVAECRELEERYRHLRDHLTDLGDASRDLGEIMSVADLEMRRRFDAAFGAVNAEFGRIFEVMLRGGSASLEQIDDEGGIGIRAQLPGRRARSSAAFSGGEKALVASSLLFGVLRIRPTPFCILDEVDAALDESNVDRYLAALRDISRRTQIIVVTHNRATMAAADVLYGLTMDDEGVSGILSLRLEAYEAAG